MSPHALFRLFNLIPTIPELTGTVRRLSLARILQGANHVWSEPNAWVTGNPEITLFVNDAKKGEIPSRYSRIGRMHQALMPADL